MTEWAKIIKIYDEDDKKRCYALIQWEYQEEHPIYILRFSTQIDNTIQKLVWKYRTKDEVIADFIAFGQAKSQQFFKAMKATYLEFDKGGTNG